MKQRMGERDGTGANRTAITSLNVLVQTGLWATPKVPNGGRTVAGERTEEGREGKAQSPHLEAQVRADAWATPTSRDYKGGALAKTKRGRDLSTDVANTTWERTRGGRAGPASDMTLADQTEACPSSLPAPETGLAGGPSSPPAPTSPPRSAKKRLNPYFVESLQGLPANWTSPTASIGSAAWETWLSLCKQRLLSLCSCLG